MPGEPLITTSLNVDVPLAAVTLPRTPPVAVIVIGPDASGMNTL